jgi:hypothetical protein
MIGSGQQSAVTNLTDTTMSYMQDLEVRLKPLLAGIPEGEQAVILTEVKKIVLESYRNGQKAGAPATKTETAQSAKAAPAKHYKR